MVKVFKIRYDYINVETKTSLMIEKTKNVPRTDKMYRVYFYEIVLSPDFADK